ncbi:3-isopropylmalate dehydratase [Phytopseudomonas dryadis]|uniref:3-isopropylmalate dehydratase n=1 Tax=Phytopseudomonas dryadis TaxID=2487520 RepID=A0A4Q9QXI8_9GAMM|nr:MULTISPECIES: 3-isopropylmalate dehydratase [Pseudomonas]TBU88155.1 3-isopropylmalate dehydratase [Pseudomonas dryadis]TBV05395.1 3-isopropylmalate dehydratase [Pseudomonas dryadis]TBV18404.1 3-isopropylmalate dehydratase [Pseudomonas sp. FRB 230]
MRSIYAVLPLLVMAGCSSFQADPEHVSAVPAERLRAYQTPLSGGGEVVVNRDLGLMGGGCYVAVLIDRKLAARIGMGEEARFQVPAGNRIVGIATDTEDDTLCGKGRLRREVAVKVEAGGREDLRIVSQNRGGFDIKPFKPKAK